jgi:hypothetical protein
VPNNLCVFDFVPKTGSAIVSDKVARNHPQGLGSKPLRESPPDTLVPLLLCSSIPPPSETRNPSPETAPPNCILLCLSCPFSRPSVSHLGLFLGEQVLFYASRCPALALELESVARSFATHKNITVGKLDVLEYPESFDPYEAHGTPLLVWYLDLRWGVRGGGEGGGGRAGG